MRLLSAADAQSITLRLLVRHSKRRVARHFTRGDIVGAFHPIGAWNVGNAISQYAFAAFQGGDLRVVIRQANLNATGVGGAVVKQRQAHVIGMTGDARIGFQRAVREFGKLLRGKGRGCFGQRVRAAAQVQFELFEPTPASTLVPSTSDFFTTGMLMVTLFALMPLLVVMVQVVSETAPSNVIRPTSLPIVVTVSSANAEAEPKARIIDAAAMVNLFIDKHPYKIKLSHNAWEQPK